MKTHREFAEEIINSRFPINSIQSIDNLANEIEKYIDDYIFDNNYSRL